MNEPERALAEAEVRQWRPTILLIDGAERGPWYAGIRDLLDAQWLTGSSEEILARADEIDLAVVNDERVSPASCLTVCELVRRQVPTLHLVDGVVEWRNTWENPTYTIGSQRAMPLFQPILCHKVACLGRSQARVFESWGNLGKCEIVGAPRLDAMLGRRPRSREAGEPLRFLVMTAKTPGFTPEQDACVRSALADLKQWFAAHQEIEGTRLRPLWRLTKGLDAELGVENSLEDFFGTDFRDLLQQVDGLVTTPSTAILEGMLQGIPVAVLDYTNSPVYNLAAWMITAPAHVDTALRGLIAAPRVRMLYQDWLLHDQLECRTPAGPRLARVMAEMARVGRDCRARQIPLEFPARILADPQDDHHLPEERFDVRSLYPEHPVFGQFDRLALQAELGHARRRIAEQQEQLARQHEQVVRQQEQLAQQQEQLARHQQQLAQLREESTRHQEQISQQRGQAAQAEQAAQRQEQLDAILRSRTWRLATKLHRVVDFVRGRR